MRWLNDVREKRRTSLFKQNTYVRINSLNLIGLAFDWLSESLFDLRPIRVLGLLHVLFAPSSLFSALNYLLALRESAFTLHNQNGALFFSFSILVSSHFPAFSMLFVGHLFCLLFFHFLFVCGL